jgi:acyl carrier protein
MSAWLDLHGDQHPTTLNVYGPTEGSVYVSLCRLTPDLINGSAIGTPIGRPLEDLALYILDDEGALVPVGVPGEIYVAGPGVTMGYLNRPELTASRYVPDPIVPERGTAYRSGDLARFLPDGSIQFLGRTDDQVKIRGYRIELGEIEHALSQHPSITACAVIAHEDRGERRLIAYIVAEGEEVPTTADLRGYLKTDLPGYMVPSVFVALEAIPLNANGKVDRRNLPDPDGARPELGHDYVAPRDDAERIIATIWEELLGVDRVGIYDNFFELGGDSISSIQAVNRIREQCGTEIPLDQFLAAPSIAWTSSLLSEIQHEREATTASLLDAIELMDDDEVARMLADLGDRS